MNARINYAQLAWKEWLEKESSPQPPEREAFVSSLQIYFTTNKRLLGSLRNFCLKIQRRQYPFVSGKINKSEAEDDAQEKSVCFQSIDESLYTAPLAESKSCCDQITRGILGLSLNSLIRSHIKNPQPTKVRLLSYRKFEMACASFLRIVLGSY